MTTSTIMTKLASLYDWSSQVKLELEHYCIALVIVISTFHVSQHMTGVEGYAIVAIIMGMALGMFNATFAYRFFEDHHARLPASVGVLFSAAVSIFMQYGFYDLNPNLEPYTIFGFLNINALVFGAWAPIFEIVLGWMYGVRTNAKNVTGREIDQVRTKMQTHIDDLIVQKTVQLHDIQALHDTVYAMKIAQSRSVSETEQLHDENRRVIADLREENAKLHDKISNLRVVNAEMNGRATVQFHNQKVVQSGVQSGVQLHDELTDIARRKSMLGMYSIDENASLQSISDRVGASKSTVRNDLKWLIENGMVHVSKIGNRQTVTLNGNSSEFLSS